MSQETQVEDSDKKFERLGMRTNTNTILVGPSVVLVPYRFVGFRLSVPIVIQGACLTESQTGYLLLGYLDVC